METGTRKVENWGTFDVPNYGDLLFPILSEAELKRRIPGLKLTLHSPQGGWFLPQPTRCVERLRRIEEPGFFTSRADVAGILLGGGDVIRHDDTAMCAVYGLPPERARLERSYRVFLHDLGQLARWLSVAWNAVGVPHPFAPEQWASVRRALQDIAYLSVRDEPSRRLLLETGLERDVAIVPDTALLIARHFPADSLRDVRASLALDGLPPVEGCTLCFQVSQAEEPYVADLVRALQGWLGQGPDRRLVLLPIGNCHGDRQVLGLLRDALGPRVALVETAGDPRTVAAVISGSTWFAGCSLHGNLTAFAYGVPQLIVDFLGRTKLRGAAAVLGQPDEIVTKVDDLSPLLARLAGGRRRDDEGLRATLIGRVDAHFDRLAEVLLRPTANRPDRWAVELEQLAGAMGDVSRDRAEAEAQEKQRLQGRIDYLEGQVSVLNEEMHWSRQRLSHLEQVIGATSR